MVYNTTIMTKIGISSLICLCSVSVSAEWARPDLVAKVASGELREARASWWGVDAADSTAYLQAGMKGGATARRRIGMISRRKKCKENYGNMV